MAGNLDEEEWDVLLQRIAEQKCTPFLGAGAGHPPLPLGWEIADKWAHEFNYPMQDPRNLPRVAQFLAVEHDAMFPKERVLKQFIRPAQVPDFGEPNEPHRILAELPFPLYMTTNYDDFMVRALREQNKRPKRELCCWNRFLKDHPSVFSDSSFEPAVLEPVVFHLHGNNEVPESLVLTEDDYLDFLVNASRNLEVLPHQIRKALSGSSLLFIGYSLEDMTFRVLFRGLVASTEKALRRINVTVQLEPRQIEGEVLLKNGDRISGEISQEPDGFVTVKSKVIDGVVRIGAGFVEGVVAKKDDVNRIISKRQEYLRRYFDEEDIRVYWGDARDFLAELKQRWEAYSHGH